MIHELLVVMAGHHPGQGGLFQPFPPEPAVATTFAIQQDSFPFLHVAEAETLNRLAQLGFYLREATLFIEKCRWQRRQCMQQKFRSKFAKSTGGIGGGDGGNTGPAALDGLYLQAFCNALETKLQSYSALVVETERLILLREQDLGGMVPVSTLAARFSQFQLLFPAISKLLVDIAKLDFELTQPMNVDTTEMTAGKESRQPTAPALIGLLRSRADSGVPIVQEWMEALLRACCAVMMRQIVSFVIYGQLEDPQDEFFIKHGNKHDQLSLPSMTVPTAARWQTELTLDERFVPALIPISLATAILFIGKAITAARQARPKPMPIPEEMTRQHLDLILPLVDCKCSLQARGLDVALLTNVIEQIRTRIAEHLWVVVRVGERAAQTLELFRSYFLISNGEFGLGVVETMDHFKAVKMVRGNSLMTTNLLVRDQDIAGLMARATASNGANSAFSEKQSEELARFAFQLVTDKDHEQQQLRRARLESTSGLFDDQLVGIPIRLEFSLAWPLDLFLSPEDLDNYGDLFSFLITVRKAQIRLQKSWMDLKEMERQMSKRNRPNLKQQQQQQQQEQSRSGKKARVETEMSDENNLKEHDMMKQVAVMRADMMFVADCLWSYLQMDVIGPTMDGLIHRISRYNVPAHTPAGSIPTSRGELGFSITNNSQGVEAIHSHTQSLFQIRRACFLTSTNLATSVKEIMLAMEAFCGVLSRRAQVSVGKAVQGFRAGLDQDVDQAMWYDWAEILKCNRLFRMHTSNLYTRLSQASRTGTLEEEHGLAHSGRGAFKPGSSQLTSSLLGSSPLDTSIHSASNGPIQQFDHLLLRLEYSKTKWFEDSS